MICCVHLKLAQWLKLIASSALGCLNTLQISFAVNVSHLKQFWPKEKLCFEVTRWQYSTADDYLGSLGCCGLAGAMQSSGSKSDMFLWIVTCPPHIHHIHVSPHTLWGCISLHQWAHYTVTHTHTLYTECLNQQCHRTISVDWLLGWCGGTCQSAVSAIIANNQFVRWGTGFCTHALSISHHAFPRAAAPHTCVYAARGNTMSTGLSW